MRFVQLARFTDAKLELFQDDIDTLPRLPYTAISHVVGEASWCDIPGNEGQVFASPQKAKFIVKCLPSLVGKKCFWMDT
jgi:hypothetical protein